MSYDFVKLSISEFRRLGYVQELNRRFLHPLGLALAIRVDDETGEEKIEGIWDYRCDPEGMYFDIENFDEERRERFVRNAQFIDDELDKRLSIRECAFGFGIEPVYRKKGSAEYARRSGQLLRTEVDSCKDKNDCEGCVYYIDDVGPNCELGLSGKVKKRCRLGMVRDGLSSCLIRVDKNNEE